MPEYPARRANRSTSSTSREPIPEAPGPRLHEQHPQLGRAVVLPHAEHAARRRAVDLGDPGSLAIEVPVVYVIGDDPGYERLERLASQPNCSAYSAPCRCTTQPMSPGSGGRSRYPRGCGDSDSTSVITCMASSSLRRSSSCTAASMSLVCAADRASRPATTAAPVFR